MNFKRITTNKYTLRGQNERAAGAAARQGSRARRTLFARRAQLRSAAVAAEVVARIGECVEDRRGGFHRKRPEERGNELLHVERLPELRGGALPDRFLERELRRLHEDFFVEEEGEAVVELERQLSILGGNMRAALARATRARLDARHRPARARVRHTEVDGAT